MPRSVIDEMQRSLGLGAWNFALGFSGTTHVRNLLNAGYFRAWARL